MTAETLRLAYAHQQAGRIEQAKACCLQILADDELNAAAKHLLGLLEYQQGHVELAARLVAAAIERDDSHATYHANLGEIHRARGRLAEAEECYRRSLSLDPALVDTRRKLGDVLKRQNKPAEAIRAYVTVLEARPDDVKTMHNLGVLLHGQRHYQEAAAIYERILQLQPRDVIGQFNHALAYLHDGRPADAQALIERYLAVNPTDVGLHVILGMTLYSQGKFREAIDVFERGIALEPEHAEIHYRLGVSLLAVGDLQRGWREFEWRLKTRFNARDYPFPRWNDEPLAGKSILVYAEYGLGDTMHFVRYARLLQKRGARVVLAVQPPLLPLLAESGLEAWPWDSNQLPRCDWQVPLLSLPMIFGTTLANIPTAVPYLRAAPALIERWRSRLAECPGLRIGIQWRCIPRAKPETRLIPLAAFEPLARLPGVTLISLQKNDEAQELHALEGKFSVVDFGAELDACGPFMDTAAIISQLDLVISCDTSIAHLAGALGAPVWVALPKVAENRWLIDRPDSPWYPTMRLFRQSTAGQWSDVFERITQAVGQMQGERCRGKA